MQVGGLCLHDGQQDEVGEPVAGVDRPQAAQQPIQFGIGGVTRRGRAPVHAELFAPGRMAIGGADFRSLGDFGSLKPGDGVGRVAVEAITPGQSRGKIDDLDPRAHPPVNR